MQDTELYSRLLGLVEPWFVERVELKMDEERVDVWVKHKRGLAWECPECNRILPCHDHAEERSWRHLDTCQVKTFLRARIPRVNCPDHGVVQVRTPWAEPRSRFTAMMESFAIKVLGQAATVKAAAGILRISWDEAWGIMERAVNRGLQRRESAVPRYVGVDEKAFRKGHSYLTIVSDIEAGTVVHVARDRKAESLESFFRRFSREELAAIEGLAMDMWVPYVSATLKCVPDATSKIVFDRFHIMQHVTKAVDQVRRDEHWELHRRGDRTLKQTRFLWLYSAENLPEDERPRFDELIALNLKVGRAWAIKESLRELWAYRSPGWARRFFKRWHAWAVRSRLEPIRRVAKLLRDRIDQIVTYCKHRITQGVAEGLNSKIMAIKRYACGFRNQRHFEIAIYFHCGGLDLHPRYPC
jgi:transposase